MLRIYCLIIYLCGHSYICTKALAANDLVRERLKAILAADAAARAFPVAPAKKTRLQCPCPTGGRCTCGPDCPCPGTVKVVHPAKKPVKKPAARPPAPKARKRAATPVYFRPAPALPSRVWGGYSGGGGGCSSGG